ncbi:hypothetical protein BDV96DRAFT_561119 [Lophiotrema nucula]|uniref:Uncharacterized protein n=1 Tax=Lophiotrema nucula TaxID=690887 RepID=A0A6A5ZUS1_9PLEO|nr:hypothetical protein BDV96DRAFT_561119 [Lophiotrema nucula]
MSSHGQKVTTDPESTRNPIQEGAGVITSDSLASESLSSGGEFGAGNPKAVASKQPSASTTTNTTDTSNATKLEAAPDAEAREAQEGWSESASLNAGAGLGKDSGVGPTYNTSSSATGTGSTETSESTTSYGNAGVAPTGAYAGSNLNEGDLKPKGKNITAGGFDDSAPNASFNQEIGTNKDPGRAAEAKYQLVDAQAGGDAGGQRQEGVSGQTASGYDTLDANEST